MFSQPDQSRWDRRERGLTALSLNTLGGSFFDLLLLSSQPERHDPEFLFFPGESSFFSGERNGWLFEFIFFSRLLERGLLATGTGVMQALLLKIVKSAVSDRVSTVVELRQTCPKIPV